MKFKSYSIITLFIFVFLLIPNFQKTDAAILTTPFGGPILMSYECTCSGGWFMLIYDYKTMMPVPLVFQFGESMMRSNYNIYTPTVQTLGDYTPGGICLLASADCGGFTTEGTIAPIGMSGIGTGTF